MSKKGIKLADTKIDDSLKSIGAIKGEHYRNVVAWLIGGLHLQHMVKALCEEIGSEDIDKTVGMQLSLVLANATAMLTSDLNLGEDGVKEIMGWAETLTEHLHNGLKQEEK